MRPRSPWGTMGEPSPRAKEALVSTLPGAESWRDAGLVEPDLEDVVEVASAASADEGEDYDPQPEPELGTKEASEVDIVEQLAEVPSDEREEYP